MELIDLVVAFVFDVLELLRQLVQDAPEPVELGELLPREVK